MSYIKNTTLSNVGSSIKVAVTGAVDSYIVKANIVSLDGVFSDNLGVVPGGTNYLPSPVATKIIFTMNNGTAITFEAQTMTNVGWSLGTLGSLNVALAAINAWL